MLRQTQLPDDSLSSGSQVKDSIRALDRLLSSPDNVLRRMARVQFTRVLSALRDKIRSERRRGFLANKPGERDITVAINIFIVASGAQRAKFQEYCRHAARCAILAKPSPLLFVTFTDFAEQLM